MTEKPTDRRADDKESSDDVEEVFGEPTAADGGTPIDGGTAAPFRTTSDVSESRTDRYRRIFRNYVVTPFSIVRNDKRALIGITILTIYSLAGLAAIFFVEPTESFEGQPYVQPFETWEFPFGTNQMGHDLFSQTVHSVVPIFQMMIAGALFTVIVGTTIGVVSGYKGGLADRVLSTLTDVFINLPGLPLVIVLAVLFNPENEVMVGILLSVAAWAGLARSIRSQVLTLREESFVEAARAMDIPTSLILYKEVLPHLMPYVMVNTANAARGVIFSAVGLYFLGILPFTSNNWGVMLNQAYEVDAYFRPIAFHWLIIPVVAITVLSIGLILLAQSLDRVFNPRVRARHADRADIDPEEEEGDATMTMGQV
ncbi:ABC transporter permease [Saliphagus infecundisoli]|uniref:ABC transporter permease n=1 Tax=Saliphagus infecundisoli TaxID=1849069 RepID=A0ABD5QI93_9EURY|nr:ABC transporter permease [Saliphagus infecundisoli]